MRCTECPITCARNVGNHIARVMIVQLSSVRFANKNIVWIVSQFMLVTNVIRQAA